jgi:signal transduction histidine kinase
VVPLAVISILAALLSVWGGDGPNAVAMVIAVVVVLAAIGTLFAAFLLGRSMSRGISEVTRATQRIANADLIALLDTMRSADSNPTALAPLQVDAGRSDEVGDLARSVASLHESLIEVSGRQMEALRNGVSNIFATLARRNSSLVDRQLAVLDELEAREESPKTLAGYYRVDHLATRMRRNAESLLVLAGSESPRVWAKPTEMTDVVRAAVGEVDEFERIEVPALEPALLSGGAVSDISHLLAELLENAIQFSPPSEPVRVTGLFGTGGYQISVSDRGVGMTEARMVELNRILDNPPALGLTVEPTLGMYVVSKLAHRHSVEVELIRGVPGITARITVPRDHLEVVESAEPRHWETPSSESATTTPDISNFSDAATREYLLKRAGLGDEPAPERQRVGSTEVVDLTSSELVGHDEARVGSLPTRTPGQSLGDDDSAAPSTGPGEGAIGIKSALAAFERGRRAAEEVDGDQEGRK